MHCYHSFVKCTLPFLATKPFPAQRNYVESSLDIGISLLTMLSHHWTLAFPCSLLINDLNIPAQHSVSVPNGHMYSPNASLAYCCGAQYPSLPQKHSLLNGTMLSHYWTLAFPCSLLINDLNIPAQHSLSPSLMTMCSHLMHY